MSIIGKAELVVKGDGVDTLREMIYWNAVGGCYPDSCGCASICPAFTVFSEDLEKKPTKCLVISGYMDSVFNMMVKTFPQQITEDVAFRIGMHLIPLYKMLCRLKMQEFRETEVMLVSISGGSRINPIFKEIRDTIQSVERVWKNLGFIVDEKKLKRGEDIAYLNGKSYYEVIESGSMPMKGS